MIIKIYSEFAVLTFHSLCCSHTYCKCKCVLFNMNESEKTLFIQDEEMSFGEVGK